MWLPQTRHCSPFVLNFRPSNMPEKERHQSARILPFSDRPQSHRHRRGDPGRRHRGGDVKPATCVSFVSLAARRDGRRMRQLCQFSGATGHRRMCQLCQLKRVRTVMPNSFQHPRGHQPCPGDGNTTAQQTARPAHAARWTLKRVQGDGALVSP
jgi:hypothetical protein